MGGCIHLPNSLLGTHQVPSVLWRRGGKSFLWGAWHWGGALWHDPMPYEGEGGQRLPLRRHLQSLCNILGWHFWMGSVDGRVSPPVLLVLNLTQLKSCGIRLVREAESCEAGPPNDQTRTMKIDFQ